MLKQLKIHNKFTLLNVIREKKVLINNFKTTSKKKKSRVLTKCAVSTQALQLAFPNRTWQFTKDKLYL